MRLTSFLSEHLIRPSNKALFVVGTPGAGKNTIISELNLESYGMKNADVDTLRRFVAAPEHTISKRVNLWKKIGVGLIINITGRDTALVEALQKDLEAHGYSTYMLFVSVDADEAWRRVTARSRPVDRDYFERATAALARAKEYYKWLFGRRFSEIDNTGESVTKKTLAPAKSDVIKWLEQ